MNTNEISKKISRFSHEIEHLLKNTDYNEVSLQNKNLINKKILNLEDPYGRKNVKLKKVILDDSFPNEVIKNQKKYSDYIA